MIATAHADQPQREAIEHSPESALITIEGTAGSGKTHTLLERARRIATTLSSDRCVLLVSPNDTARFTLEPMACIAVRSFTEIAFDLITQGTLLDEDAPEPSLIDDMQAAHLFERAAAELLSLEWKEFATAEIDPEVSGLRTPERFIAAAFRLVRKLRAAQIAPEEFEALCLRGATAFYERLPNFTDPELIARTSVQYRDSLRANDAEIRTQRLREIDLAKIIARLHARYCEISIAEQQYGACDAVAEATKIVRANDLLRQAFVKKHPYACIDDAQDITTGEMHLLQALYGHELHGVTLAGDASEATRTFSGARGERVFTQSKHRFTLLQQYRCPQAIVNIARRAIDPRAPVARADQAVTLHRTETPEREALYVADTIARLISNGTPCERIAVITRTVRCVDPLISALLKRDIPIDIAGDANLLAFPCVRDALALLWCVADPYRHDWLLRTLELPILALSDASIALLCGEPSHPQTALFTLPETENENGRSRRDRERDLRLGRNVTRGDRDGDLPPEAARRLMTFRAARERWETLERELDLPTLARVIFAETLFSDTPQNARARFEAGLMARLLEEIDAFTRRDPLGSLRDFLLHLEHVDQTDEDLCSLRQWNEHAVAILSVEAAKARSFDHVFIIDARAAGFARYYTPDAFLFYPSLGIIAKENVGDGARAARTAKFTYALHKYKTRELYVEEERRAFAYAATRAQHHLWITASGRATRGNAAPEFLEEIRNADIPGVTHQA